MTRPNHGRWLVVPALLLQGCPQLLDDKFSLTDAPGSGPLEPCKGPKCAKEEPGGATPTSPAPDAGSTPAPAGPTPPPSMPPPSDAAAPPPDPSATEPPACWTIVLNDSTHIASNNCLDIHGWNQAVVDETTDSRVTTSYAGGKVCFEGQLATQGWGIVYNFTFADEATWNAQAHEVAGMQLEVSGPTPPPRVEVIYSVNGNQDFCRALQPVVTASVPFSSTHPDCATAPGSAAPDLTALTHLRLHFPVSTATHAFDFCLGLRATP